MVSQFVVLSSDPVVLSSLCLRRSGLPLTRRLHLLGEGLAVGLLGAGSEGARAHLSRLVQRPVPLTCGPEPLATREEIACAGGGDGGGWTSF